MKSKILIALCAAALFPLAAFAHDCSGGTDGGMDATGNQCNTPAVVTSDLPDRATPSSAQPPKAVAKKAAGKRTTTTRNASERSRSKHG